MNLETHMPDWVAERLTADNVDENSLTSRKYVQWQLDADFVDAVPSYNPVLFDSKNVHWSHGHLAPASHHKDSQESVEETFLQPTNVVPQEFSVNGGDWNRLENFTALLFEHDASAEVFVISGPLWLSDEKARTDWRQANQGLIYDIIPVPTHLFKVIKFKSPKKGDASVGFLMPNAEIPDLKPLNSFARPLAEIEAISGLDLGGYKTYVDLCTVADCVDRNDRYMTLYMHCLKIQSRVKQMGSASKLRAVVQEAYQLKCFDDNVNNQKAALALTIKQRAQQILKTSFPSDPQSLVEWILPDLDKIDHYYYEARRFLKFSLLEIWHW